MLLPHHEQTPQLCAYYKKHSNINEQLIIAGAYFNLNDGNETTLIAACKKTFQLRFKFDYGWS